MITKKNTIKGLVIVNAFLIVGLVAFLGNAVAETAEATAPAAEVLQMSTGFGLMKAGIAIGAGLAVGIAGFGAGLGVGIIGSAALGAIAEDKSMVSWSFIFIALAEGVAIYGLIIAILLWLKIGTIGAL